MKFFGMIGETMDYIYVAPNELVGYDYTRKLSRGGGKRKFLKMNIFKIVKGYIFSPTTTVDDSK